MNNNMGKKAGQAIFSQPESRGRVLRLDAARIARELDCLAWERDRVERVPVPKAEILDTARAELSELPLRVSLPGLLAERLEQFQQGRIERVFDIPEYKITGREPSRSDPWVLNFGTLYITDAMLSEAVAGLPEQDFTEDQRAARIAQIDAEIAALEAEREKLV